MRVFFAGSLVVLYAPLCDAFSITSRASRGMHSSLLNMAPDEDNDWSMGLFDDTKALKDDPTAFRVGILGDLHIGECRCSFAGNSFSH